MSCMLDLFFYIYFYYFVLIFRCYIICILRVSICPLYGE